MIKNNNNNNNSMETRYEGKNRIIFDGNGNIFDDKNYLMQILHAEIYIKIHQIIRRAN